MKSNESYYKYFFDGNVLFIEDMNKGKSVTNNIENILKQITLEERTSMDNFRIMYRDTDGIIDGIETKDGKFSNFYPIMERAFYTAKLKIKR